MNKTLDQLAEEYCERNLDCICNPDHPLYDAGTCWFHLSPSEQYKDAFKAGWAAHEERAKVLVDALLFIREGGFLKGNDTFIQQLYANCMREANAALVRYKNV